MRYLYGATAADWTSTRTGEFVPNITLSCWDAQTGGNQITDLINYQGSPSTLVLSDDDGLVRFYGPDNEQRVLWLDTGETARVAVRPVDLRVLKDNAVVTADITNAAVTEAKIADGAVATAKLADSAVSTAKVANAAVTNAKLGDAAVNSVKLADGAVGTPKIADGAVSLAKLGPDVVLGGGGGGAGIAVDVKLYGAVGDGSTNDTDAIEAAISAAGAGGVVYFPRGTYKVTNTLWPLNGQRWTGEHIPKYWHADTPNSSCTIQAATPFTGRALVERGSGVYGVMLERLCLHGWDETSGTIIDGVHLGDGTGERAWSIDWCTIRRFSGCGLTGRMHVADMRDCHIVRNGYGVRSVSSNSITDMRINACQFYYNLNGGICLDSTSRNGMLSINSTRVERTGSTPGVPAVNRNTNAPGVRITNSVNIDLVQVSTDANSGPGLLVQGNRGGGTYVTSLAVLGCNFARDGGGDQSAGVQVPGVKVVQADHMMFVGNHITWGQADDGGGGVITPYYMLWLEDVYHSVFTANWTVANTAANSLHLVGSNWRTKVDSVYLGFDCLRPAADSERTTANLPVGASYFSTTSNRPKFWTGSAWVNADGSAG
jgi:hypothetical protein